MSEELYEDLIIDHYHHPRCHGCPEDCSASCRMRNPLCGDLVRLGLTIKDGSISAIGFEGHGCSISQASASMMSELCNNKSMAEIEHLRATFQKMLSGEATEKELEELGDVALLAGVRKVSARVRCAALAWEALEQCLTQMRKDVSQ
jgi:nitrogen fixation NifU-like protein